MMDILENHPQMGLIYLQNRQKGSKQYQTPGVPQGSIPGPALFNLKTFLVPFLIYFFKSKDYTIVQLDSFFVFII